ncbi:hypothetical protein [Sinorhizobium saheli]|nr:hypothetical protein [Sinorhizobium saheli]
MTKAISSWVRRFCRNKEPSCVFLDAAREEDQMQQKFMSTDAFLRLEKEWQRMRHARHNLEIEAVRPDDQGIGVSTGLEPASITPGQIKSS